MLGFAVWITVVAAVPAAVVVFYRLSWRGRSGAAPARAWGERARHERTAMMAAASVAVVAPIALVVQIVATHEGDEAWVLGALAAGALVTLGVLARAVLGDPSRGRRRCPKCWYDMGGSPGLVCPECGSDAHREARLLRTRRHGLALGASLVPMAAGIALYSVWFLRNYPWVDGVPTCVLVAASPWTNWDDRLGSEYASRVAGGPRRTMYAPERWLATRLSRGVVAGGGRGSGSDPRSVLYHAWVLKELERTDASTIAALASLSASADSATVIGAIGVLTDVQASEEVERVFAGLIERPEAGVRSAAIEALLKVKRQRPGGAAPARLVADATGGTQGRERFRACQLLGLYDPSPESRAALENAAEGTDLIHGAALVALARHAPDDAAVQGMIAASLRDPARSGRRAWIVESLLRPDVRTVDEGRELPPHRRALYTDEVRAAILAGEAEAGADGRWSIARGLLLSHPCFSAAELQHVRRGDSAPATGESEALPARLDRGPQP